MVARKPTNLKKLEGTFRKDRALKEPKPAPVAPKRPAWLSSQAKKVWNELAPKLERVGCLTKVDGETLALLCTHYAVAKQAAEILKQEGLVDHDERGLARKHPMLQVLRDNSAAYLKYCQEFGLSPKARGRIDVTEPFDEEDQGMARLLSGPANWRG